MSKPLYVVQIPREHIESGDISMIQDTIKTFVNMKASSQCLEIIVDGYDHIVDEVFEIMDVRNWFIKLLKIVPEVLYYTAIDLGSTYRVLACCYDVETFRTERMNAYEATDYMMEHGEPHLSPLVVTISGDELSRLCARIKGHGIKVKDIYGAGIICENLKGQFGKKD